MSNPFVFLCHGIALTIAITLCSLIVGLAAAIGLTFILQSQAKIASRLATLYVIVIRGTPLLLQLFFVYYGLGQLTLVQHSILWPILKNPLYCGIIVLANNSMAYVSNLLTGIMNKIPQNQINAATNAGLSHRQQFISIKLPYALKRLMPYYQNEMVILLKSSSLMSTITVLELTGSINQIVSLQFHNLLWYCVSALIYVIINLIMHKIMLRYWRPVTF